VSSHSGGRSVLSNVVVLAKGWAAVSTLEPFRRHRVQPAVVLEVQVYIVYNSK